MNPTRRAGSISTMNTTLSTTGDGQVWQLPMWMLRVVATPLFLCSLIEAPLLVLGATFVMPMVLAPVFFVVAMRVSRPGHIVLWAITAAVALGLEWLALGSSVLHHLLRPDDRSIWDGGVFQSLFPWAVAYTIWSPLCGVLLCGRAIPAGLALVRRKDSHVPCESNSKRPRRRAQKASFVLLVVSVCLFFILAVIDGLGLHFHSAGMCLRDYIEMSWVPVVGLVIASGLATHSLDVAARRDSTSPPSA